MCKLFTKSLNAILPIIKKVYPPVRITSSFVSIILNCCKGTCLYEELWLEDFGDDEFWCPQIDTDRWIDEYSFKEMRRKELVFEDWEIEQLNTYVEGIGNKQKLLVMSDFKAMWFPEKS